jgi:diguanylate cyclase (GGDEF)-like protein
MAITDSLTGLYNRRRFQESMEKEFHRCHRYKIPLSCLLIDIDHFKLVNDTYGHQTGDAVLSEIGTILLKTFREIDTVSRYGGEEFSALLPETDRKAAIQAAGRLVARVAGHPFTGRETALTVTVSVGVAGIPDDSIVEADQLLQAADFALYRAKEGGRNRIEVCEHFQQYKQTGAARPRSS